MNVPITGNVLDTASPPPGSTVSVTSFSIAGRSQVYVPGPNPITLNDPKTGEAMGTITFAASGTYVFTPVQDFIGPAPAISLNLRSSDGQTAVSALTLDVVRPGERWQRTTII